MKFIPASTKTTKSSKIIHMKPSKFLDLSFPQKPGEDTYDSTLYTQSSLKRLERRIKQQKEIDIPHFDVEVEPERGRIVGHGGRHRAFVSHILGVKKIPVELRFKMVINQLKIIM